MLPKEIYLIDQGVELVEAWDEVFSKDEIFKPIQADYFSVESDAMVSPANSFGIMDGGLDLVIRDVQCQDSTNHVVHGNIYKHLKQQP